MLPHTYDAVWFPDDGEEQAIDLSACGWLSQVNGNGQFTLVPKRARWSWRRSALPTLTVRVAAGTDLPYFCRVVGNTSVGPLFRVYRIGQAWVYPNGTVELGEEPSWIDAFIHSHIMYRLLRAAQLGDERPSAEEPMSQGDATA